MSADRSLLPAEALAALGLARQPFTGPLAAGNLFTDPALDMALNVLLEHLKDRAQPLLLKGETGVGKTTMLERLRARATAQIHLCPIEGGPDISMAAIDYSIRLQWQPRPEHGDPRKLTIDRYLVAVMEGGACPVLVIDDAHRLEPQVLAGLFTLKQRLQSDYGQTLGLVLAAEPQIETTLAAFADRVPMVGKLYTVTLRPFNREQTRAYVVHRLRAAGAVKLDVLDEASLQRIQQETGGVASRINEGAARELSGAPRTRQGTAASWPLRALVPATATVVVIGLALSAYGLLRGLGDDAPEGALPVSPAQSPLPHPTPAAPALAPPSHEREVAMSDADHLTVPEGPPEVGPPLEVAGDAVVEGTVEPKAVTAPAVPAGGDTEHTRARDTPASPPAQSLAERGLVDSLWLLQQDPESYTVQVLGVSTEEAVRRFHRTHRIAAPMAYYKAPRDGHEWYVVVVGVYPSPEAARAAIPDFPAQVRANQPWIRRLGDVQLAILTAREASAQRP